MKGKGTGKRLTSLGLRLPQKISPVIFLVLLGPVAVYAQQDEETHGQIPPRVEIAGTQLLHISSSVVGREYDLYVHLPGNYKDTTRRFPVLYVLDAQWDFELVDALYGQQYYDGFIPAAIIVGITWGGKNPNHDSLRARDLSPTFNKEIPHSGNGPKFLAFIKNELIPMIDSNYRTTKNDRTLMGSSFGGLFTLYALFTETEVFNRYVLTSPNTGWDNEVIYFFEKNYAARRSGIPVRVYIAEGEWEDGVSKFKKFVDHLESQQYKGLELRWKIIEGVGHSGGKAEGFTRGLQAVFERPALSIDPAILDRYVGDYQVGPGMEIEISRETDHLVVTTPDNADVVLQAETENDFYVRGRFLSIHVKKDGAGKVSGFLLERYGGEMFATKVNE
jgi:predicted alpha/beta superfamily hydrolase